MMLRPGTRLDLHLHTTASDGRYDVQTVLALCARGGLELVALTDHDLAPDLPVGPLTVGGRTLHLLGGAEVSGVHEGVEHHLLVYFPGEIPAAFRAFCKRQCAERAVRYHDAMDVLGLPHDPDPTAASGDRALTRLHLAHALIEAGVVGSRAEAFARYLGDAHATVRPLSLPFVDAIRFARAQGGLTSWAHPPRFMVERHLETFVRAGLQGLEGVRPQVSSEDRRFYRKAAARHGLYLTGGSDWHGWHAPEPGLFRVHAAEIADFVDALRAGS